jgi:hypothetical protein
MIEIPGLTITLLSKSGMDRMNVFSIDNTASAFTLSSVIVLLKKVSIRFKVEKQLSHLLADISIVQIMFTSLKVSVNTVLNYYRL